MSKLDFMTKTNTKRRNIIFASYYDEVWAPIVKSFCDLTGADVCDWLIAYPSQDHEVNPAILFPNAAVHQPYDATRGRLPPVMQLAQRCEIDRDLLNKMSHYEHMFMCLLDIYDPNGRTFSSRERRETYYDLLRYAVCIISNHQPNLYIAATIPHSLHDYILYCVCRVYGIPTLVCMPTSLPGYLIWQDSLEEGSSKLKSHYQKRLTKLDNVEVTLPSILEDYYITARLSYDIAKPWYVKLRDHSLLRSRRDNVLIVASAELKSFISETLREMRRLIKFVFFPIESYKNLFVQEQAEIFKIIDVQLRNVVTTRHATERIFAKGKKIKKRLYSQYLKLQRQPDFSLPYIFVPLHYQPEASTTPLGGVFSDQILMIRMLARNIPNNWRIYVKEHQTTFDPTLRGHFSRDFNYYSEINEIPGVELVPMSFSSFDMIDRAKAVATVTGTAGWEAVIRGVPSIVFGNAWYKDCHGVFDGRNHEGCVSAINQIKAGFKPNPKFVKEYMMLLHEIGFRADRDNSYKLTDYSLLQSQEIITESLIRAVESINS